MNSLSEGILAVVGGAIGVGVLGLELGFEVAGVAKGVFEVELMVCDAFDRLSGAARVQALNA